MPAKPRDAWRAGDLVHVAPYGKGTIVEVRNGGRYLIEVKGRSMVIEGSRIQKVEPTPAGRRGRDSATAPSSPVPIAATPRPLSSLDLHGKTVQEATEALDAFLNAALLRGDAQVEVIHGRSGGRLKAAVHGRLKQVTSVRGFRLDPRNPGVTIVIL